MNFNDKMGKLELNELQNLKYEEVLRDAMEATKLNTDFTSIKDFFLNMVIKAFADTDFKQEKV